MNARINLGWIVAVFALAGCASTSTREERREERRASSYDEARRIHAEAHSRSADALAHFDAQECRDIPPQERSACPILHASSVEDIPEGERLTFETQAIADETYLRMKCFAAFAHANGDRDRCPLAVEGMDVRTGLVASSIELIGFTEPVRAEIRERTRRFVQPIPQASEPVSRR
jgi:hypothetical protein